LELNAVARGIAPRLSIRRDPQPRSRDAESLAQPVAQERTAERVQRPVAWPVKAQRASMLVRAQSREHVRRDRRRIARADQQHVDLAHAALSTRPKLGITWRENFSIER